MTLARRVTRPRRAPLLGRAGRTVALLLALGLVAAWRLELDPRELVPGAGGRAIAREFFGAAFRPALRYQADFVPSGAPPFLWVLLTAVWRTIVFATAAMSLALCGGLVLGVLSSNAWWRGGRATPWLVALQTVVRLLVIALRSVHELLWAVLFLAALGLSPATGVLAIAIPYTGVLAKVFSELLDETPRDVAETLLASGTRVWPAFLFGLLPRAAPDMAAYAFYRYECALRSSAILGFFGFPTLGYYVHASFDNLHFREVWTYLYALIALVLLLEFWSGRLRARVAV